MQGDPRSRGTVRGDPRGRGTVRGDPRSRGTRARRPARTTFPGLEMASRVSRRSPRLFPDSRGLAGPCARVGAVAAQPMVTRPHCRTRRESRPALHAPRLAPAWSSPQQPRHQGGGWAGAEHTDTRTCEWTFALSRHVVPVLQTGISEHWVEGRRGVRLASYGLRVTRRTLQEPWAPARLVSQARGGGEGLGDVCGCLQGHSSGPTGQS